MTEADLTALAREVAEDTVSDYQNCADVGRHMTLKGLRVTVEGYTIKALRAAVAQALGALTDDDWDVVEDGLITLESEEREQARLWNGRSRAPKYQRAANLTHAVLVKVQALSQRRTPPTQPKEAE